MKALREAFNWLNWMDLPPANILFCNRAQLREYRKTMVQGDLKKVDKYNCQLQENGFSYRRQFLHVDNRDMEKCFGLV